MVFFAGEYTGKIDIKGRLVLPARFKAQLPVANDSEVVLRMGFKSNLQVYPVDVYKLQHEKIAALSAFDPQQLDLRRYFFSRTVFLSLDNLGRLLLPRHFMGYAQLKQEALIVGVGDFMEVWSPKIYQEQSIDTEHYVRLSKRLLSE